MSTGYSWEGIRQVRATLLCARHVPECLWGLLLGALYQVLYLYLSLYCLAHALNLSVYGRVSRSLPMKKIISCRNSLDLKSRRVRLTVVTSVSGRSRPTETLSRDWVASHIESMTVAAWRAVDAVTTDTALCWQETSTLWLWTTETVQGN